MHVSDPDQLPVCLLHEAAQFLDQFGKMSQMPLHSLFQHALCFVGLRLVLNTTAAAAVKASFLQLAVNLAKQFGNTLA